MGLLGVGSYDCVLQSQGGEPLLDMLSWTSLSFQRRLDVASAATVTVMAGSSPRLGEIDAWSHELAIWRDGAEAWVGPIQQPDWDVDVVSIQAADLYAWLQRRLLDRFDRSFVNVDAASIFAKVVDDAMSADRRPAIGMATADTGVLATRSIVAAQQARASDVLDELARTAVDFTCLGRQIRVGAQEVPGTSAFMLTDDTLLSPKLSSRGVDAATSVKVIGGGGGTTPAIVGSAGGATADYGLVQQTFSEPGILDSGSAGAAASTRQKLLHEPPKYLSGVLSPYAPVDFELLIPGTRVTAKLMGLDRSVDGAFRLSQVDVNVRPGGQGLQEEIAVTLEPLGTISGA